MGLNTNKPNRSLNKNIGYFADRLNLLVYLPIQKMVMP